LKVVFEPAEVMVPNNKCVFCEKKISGFRIDWILLGWGTWDDTYKKGENTYIVKKKTPIQAHVGCANNARVVEKTD
jgi:hypothetical protein